MLLPRCTSSIVRSTATSRVEYVEADLFEYVPEERYDLVFAGFCLSHVPGPRFKPFWDMVATALAPNGCVVMIDDGICDSDGVPRFADDPTGSDAHRKLWDGQGSPSSRTPTIRRGWSIS